MSDLVDKLPQIPAVMKHKGWNTAAALMQKWFSGPPSSDRAKQSPDTTDVTMNWVLGFPRAAAVYNKLVSDRVWVNFAAKNEISHMLRGSRLTSTSPVPFGNLGAPAPALDKHYINERPFVSSLSDPLDDLFGALGSFNFRVAVEGIVAPAKPAGFEITINKVGVYVHDSYDFDDDHWYSQPLGFWKFDGSGDVGKLPWPGYQAVFNSSFQDYRTAKHHGGDFWVYSDVKVINIWPPDKFVTTL